jgi:hypothetical protein
LSLRINGSFFEELESTVIVEYRTNNSGGSFWLADKNWKDLEAAGWNVKWRSRRFLGALATTATREGLSMGDAIDEWERVTGLDSAALGCNCCGAPHSFSDSEGNYYYPEAPISGGRYRDYDDGDDW